MTAKDKKKMRKEKRRIEKKRSKGKNINRHHICPRSRGGSDEASNLAYVDMFKHRDYHRLFDNKTPEEIINFLVDYFWKGQTDYIFNALSTRRS